MPPSPSSAVHVFGIRHHGPGSARSLRRALESLRPDAILLEGPPDAADALALAAHPNMAPPVALMVYAPDEPKRAVFYPFAVFSPEWQALQYGLAQSVPVRFMDLPVAHRLALPDAADEDTDGEGDSDAPDVQEDPLHWIARAAGYPDGERWWEHMVEQRPDGADLFPALLDAMAELRASSPPSKDPLAPQREAYMRQTIRATQREGFERIAVVCGAWHAPVLAEMPTAKSDADLLKGLPKAKVQATWVPWTYGRLSYHSGYGAGVISPGWYHHLFTAGDQVAVRWMIRIARLLRDEDLDASSAHVIEAVRLGESLAALRGRPLPGLPELNEAARTVFCFGSAGPMQVIQEKLIIGERLGAVPDETPMVPLQQDLSREQKRLRLPPDPAQRQLDLDLRKPLLLERSHLLHRLGLLGIPWGQVQRVTGKEGTFHELWTIQWQPDFVVALVEASAWGNTIHDAAAACASDAADHASDLAVLTHLLDRALLADLPDAVSHIMARLQSAAALTGDVGALMDALPPLVNILRYGNVRQTDAGMVAEVVDGLVPRICIGLPGACGSLNDEAAGEMLARLARANHAIVLLQNEDHLEAWHAVLGRMSDLPRLHGLLAGRCSRILLDARRIAADEAGRRMGLALSTATEPPQAAAWIDGFLSGSGLLLLHDDALWNVLDTWVAELRADAFTALLPLLRRTFSTFPPAERRQIGERARRGPADLRARAAGIADDVDAARARAVLPLIAQLLGLPAPADSSDSDRPATDE